MSENQGISTQESKKFDKLDRGSVSMKKFYVDLKKIEEKAKEQGISERALSTKIGRSPTWYHSVKKRGNDDCTNPYCARIRRESATAIASLLGCVVQDISCSAEHSSNVVDPMQFDYIDRTKKCFEALRKDDPVLLDSLLHAMQEMRLEQRKMLVTVANALPNSKENTTKNDDRWWKILFYVELGKCILPKVNCCTVSELQAECVRGRINRGVSKDVHKWGEIIEEILKSKTHEWTENLSICEGKDIKKAISRCASILQMYFKGADAQGIQTVIDLYKEGLWCISFPQ